jgi:transposase
MVVLGVDSHKKTHTAVAVDGNGRQVAEQLVKATSAGHLELVRWAEQFDERTWALEDCRQLSRRLEADLLRAGEVVVRVPPKLMADARRSTRNPGKSDPIDALAVARVALREDNLPWARLDGPEREVRVLLDHREDLVAERTRHQNRLLWHLHELEPGWELKPRSLSSFGSLDAVEARLGAHPGRVAAIAVEVVQLCRGLTGRINKLEDEIADLVAPLVPTLLALHGCGGLTAAKIVGETAGVSRFRSRDAYARYNGTAPIPVWSGNSSRHRLNRGGNRQLNSALHRIAITQLRYGGRARELLERRMAGGATKKEALRSVRRRLSDVVYRCLVEDARLRGELTTGLSQAA